MLDPKFKYNGKIFSLEAIDAKAASKGLSTEDYLKQNPKITKIEDSDFQTPTTPGAVVEETAAPGTESKSEDPSLVSSDPELSAQLQFLDEVVVTGKRLTPNQIKSKNNLKQFQNTVSDLLKNYDPNTEEGYYDFFGEEVEGATLVDKYNSNPKAFEKYLKRYALANTFGDEDQRNLFEKATFAYKYRGFVNKKNVDGVVQDEIQKLLESEGQKELKENIDNVISYKKAGLYGESIKFTFNNFFKHLPDHEKKIFNIKNQIDDLQLELDNFEASGLTDEGKKKELIIKRNNLNQELNNIVGSLGGRDAYQFKNRTPLFNLYGDPVSELEAINFKKENVKTFEVEYDDYVKTFKNKNREALQNGFFNLGLDILDLENEMNQKYTIKFDAAFLQESSTAAEKIVEAGFKIKTKNGKIISNAQEIEDEYIKEGEITEQLSYNDLVKIFSISDSGKIIGDWNKLTIMDVNGQNISGEDFRDDLYNEKIDLGLQKAAYRETFILNLDPASKTTDGLDVAETFIKEAITGIGKMFYDKAGDRIPLTRQEELDAVYSVFQDIGYEMTDEQKEAFDKSFAMEFAEGLGGFVPDLIQFAMLNKVAGATGITTRIANLMKSNKFYGVLSNMMLEGVKFQVVMGDPSSEMFTEGAAFGGFSMAATGALGKLGIQLSGRLAPLNAIFQKGTAGGFGMATGSEGAQIVHGVIDDFLGDKALVTSMKELYGDFDETVGRVLMNGALGSFIPIVQTHPAHFKTMAARTNLLHKLRSEIIEGKYEGIEAKQKLALIGELQRDVNLYNKKFDALDIQSQKKAADDALSIVNSKEITVIENGKEVTRTATTTEIREAQKTINRYETNKADARKKIYEWDSALREAGIVSKDYKGVKIYDFKNKAEKEKAVTAGIFESVNNKAQYNSTTKEVAIDINSFKKGVWSQEIGHVFMRAAFNSNPKAAMTFKTAIENKVNKDLEGVKFEVGDKKGLTFEQAINEAYKGKNNVPEEYVMNVLEFLANPRYKALMLEKGVLQSVKESLLQHGNFLGLNFSNKKNFRTPEELLTFFENLGTQLESSNVKSIKKQYKDFSNIVIDGKKLINLKTGKDIKKEIKQEKAASKDIVAENTRIEKEILKSGKEISEGVFKPNEAQRTDLLINNLGLIGDMARKLSDPARHEAFNVPISERFSYNSFYGELYTIADKISTQFKIKKGETAPFGAYLKQRLNERYPLAFKELKKGKQDTIRIEDTTVGETLTSGAGSKEIQKELINPLERFVPSENKRKEYQKQYETNIKVDETSNYATLKDASPKTTGEIYGKNPKEIKENIKKFGNEQFDIMPEPSRKVTEEQIARDGFKSSTEIKDSVLDIISIKAEAGEVTATGRADMTTGTAAGLTIRAKMPDYSVTRHPRGDYKGYTVQEAVLERAGIGRIIDGKLVEYSRKDWIDHYNKNGIPAWHKPKKNTNPSKEKQINDIIRNQDTFRKAWVSELGRATTNMVARQNPNHPQNLIEQLASGKSEVLASKIINEVSNIKKEAISDKIFEIFGGEVKEKDLQGIMESFYTGIRTIPDFSLLVLSSNLAPSGSSLKRIFAGKQTFFASNKKGFEKEVKDAINEGRVLDLHALLELKNQLGGGDIAPKWAQAIQSQTTQKYKKAIEKGITSYNQQKKTHQDGVVKVLDILADFYKINPKAAGLLAYNSNANFSSTKNMAQMRGMEVVIDGKKFEIREEHVLQHGQFARLSGEYVKLKNNPKADPTTIKELGEYIAKYYFQLSLASKNPNEKGIKFEDRVDSHAKVDRTYEFVIDGITYKVNLKSELHPVHEMQVQEALAGKRKWSEVISPLIRMYNSAVAKGKGGSINMNKVMQDGISHATLFDLVVPKSLENTRIVFEKQAELAERQMLEPGYKGKQELDLFIKNRFPKIKKGAEVIEKAQAKDAQINKQKVEIAASKDISGEFNQYLEKSTGIGAQKVFDQAKADARAAQVKKSFGDYILPPGAEDFGGLMHKTLAKGKQGEKQLEFYKQTLYDPYNLAMENITRERISLTNDFRALKNDLGGVPKNLKQFTKGGDYTKEQAVRVTVWNKLGYEIPGISKSDLKALVKEVNSNPELNLFANELIRITKGDGYAKPDNSWVAGNIAIDMMSLLNGVKRTKHLEVWQNNVNEIFSKENLLKLEAAYGKEWVKNVTRTLERMKTGSNRKWGGNETVQKWNDWVNGSVGTIMFLNTRSAVLQTISNINYINFSDNNPLQAAKAFANQKQYWKDFIDIFNSGYLRDRRGYNKININESELALAAEKGGARGVISMLLNKGFVLTKIADSFAIASGGATMYRNRLNRYKKEGMSEKEAAKKAFLDFKEITEKTQQSSRPDKISEQQAGGLGRFMLAFANTPMQYNRMIKRDIQDMLAGRGNRNEQLTRITYYTTIQNFIFNALQKGLFAMAFSTDENNEKDIAKFSQVGEGMGDSLLRGTGLTGNAAVAVKNVIKAYAKGEREPALKALTISPPLYGKLTRLRGANYSLKSVTKNNMFEPSLNNPALSATAQLSSAAFNLPLDRALRKAQNIEAAMSDDAEYWQKVALLLGWGSWELGIEKNKKSGDVFSRTRKGFEKERTSLFDRKRTSIFK